MNTVTCHWKLEAPKHVHDKWVCTKCTVTQQPSYTASTATCVIWKERNSIADLSFSTGRLIQIFQTLEITKYKYLCKTIHENCCDLTCDIYVVFIVSLCWIHCTSLHVNKAASCGAEPVWRGGMKLLTYVHIANVQEISLNSVTKNHSYFWRMYDAVHTYRSATKNIIYTPWVKKGRHDTLVHIFARYWPIFTILSPTYSVGNLQ